MSRKLELLNRISGRLTVVLVTIGLCVLAIAAVIVAAFWNIRYGLPTHDKTTVINTVATIGAFILVAWGVIVALVAYMSATGSPDLSLDITFRFSFPNEPTFSVADKDEWLMNWRKVKAYRQVEGAVQISNDSKYSARNPGVRIVLDGLGGIPDQPGWEVVARANQIGITALQWDGGADYIIHGKWSRILPTLNVQGMFAFKDDPALVVDVAADGYGPKRIRMPVRILDDTEYDQYSLDRLERLKRAGAIREGPSGEAG